MDSSGSRKETQVENLLDAGTTQEGAVYDYSVL